mmetsp:Transcript_4361/g.7947  ORF Transcript_4361/g.7947 Transcript_4361/m.7947 type:complete len:312 (-) Transcript_4361:100-1035(-)
MRLEHCHHVGELAVLVGFGAVEVATVHHGNAFAALSEAVEFSKISPRPHGSSSDGIRVASYGADDHDARILRLLDHREHQVDEQEVREVVHLSRGFVTLYCIRSLWRGWKVQRCVAHKRVHLASRPEPASEFPDTFEGFEFDRLDTIAVFREPVLLGDGLGLVRVANAHDHVPVAALDERLGRRQPEARRRASDHRCPLPVPGRAGTASEGCLEALQRIHEHISALGLHDCGAPNLQFGQAAGHGGLRLVVVHRVDEVGLFVAARRRHVVLHHRNTAHSVKRRPHPAGEPVTTGDRRHLGGKNPVGAAGGR